ncbi:sulfite exporter TauE/SafE family protein [Paractinoplanes lichenicola]|uniref:Probable membrane transporter protein n=1 Tax=Paractinoplanes lichenicola TaxID=2802976 RepID=A0ABS1VY99_9ACTN|nr:sulfite exporter TauE/SafE family protein [Actinoplanes lichenicola]MBL7259475.1 sulfite exporter TauE/SafE family protein [Actinoplanes lichenicola]
MLPVADVLAVGAVAIGAVLQRATGLGFALVAAPFLVVILGPFTGVTLANLLSAGLNLIVLATTARALRGRLAAQMIAGAVLALPLGVWVVHVLPGSVLLVGVGLISALSVAWVAVGQSMPWLRRRGGAVASGFASGFFNTTAGTGGPPLAVYKMSTGWDQHSFVPTVQLVGLVSNVLSLASKGWPSLSPPLLLACGGALLAGIGGGHFLAARLPDHTARTWVVMLALAGSLIAVGKGVAALW